MSYLVNTELSKVNINQCVTEIILLFIDGLIVRTLFIFLLPGFAFQGVIVAGGYATGQEIIQFFLKNGTYSAICGLALAALIWGVGLSVLFEISRVSKSYDYKSLLQELTGPLWRVNEILLGVLSLLVSAVILSTAGELSVQFLSLSSLEGMILLSIAITLLAWSGSKWLEIFMIIWSALIYLVFAFMAVTVINGSADAIADQLDQSTLKSAAWIPDGIAYAAYNISSCIAILYCLKHITTRKQAIASGFIAGLMGAVPALLLLLAMIAFQPEILTVTIPSLYVLEQLNMPLFTVIFQIVFMGTLVQTGVSIIHSINQRIEVTYTSDHREYPKIFRIVISFAILLIGALVASNFSLADIIRIGYTVVGAGFLIFFVVPLFTVGIYRVIKESS